MFRIDSSVLKDKITREHIKTTYKQRAKYIILHYHFGADEVRLDQYLRSTYKKGLIDICLLLLNYVYIQDTQNGDLDIFFRDRQYDKLVRLISYGAIPGARSAILQKAFSWKGL